ncbi:type IV pilus twitching motility protein PilT [Frondihabitans cladoniiphilus]|uniref:Bacterial type II secretion system protein E domain-containing protein n=1 Tax=Frondihabitans cladoniiphilus TaxID=715785 RepID=A0ABP8VX64_9MICO
MSDPIYDLPGDPSARPRPVYSLDDTSGGEAAGGWTPAPASHRYSELPTSPRTPGIDEILASAVPPTGSGFAAPFGDPVRPAASAVFDLQTPTAWDAQPPAPSASPLAAAPAPSGQAPLAAPAPAGHARSEFALSSRFPAGSAASTIELSVHAATEAEPHLIEALCQVVLQGGSDLHVTVDAAPTIRIDGHLQPVLSPEPWDRERVSTALRSLLTRDRNAEFDEHLELDFAYSLSAESRFRVNFYQQRGVLGAVFRLIPTEIKTLEELGMDGAISKFAGLPRGLVLVTGPTGSGKSTTLAALIDLVNSTRADHIVTVEDPIEFMHQHKKALVNQREVGADTHSFANALKHVLRQDPDVILIGELRDLETISVALTAAETGHLVFATLHTQDAAQTIDRVIDVFPPHQQDQVRTQLASTLQGVVCQTLVPRASGKGRVVATEIMMMTPAVGNLIREGKTYQIASSMQAGRDLGMHTMDQSLADLVNTGTITSKAAMEKVHDEEGFHRLVTRTDTGASNGLAANGLAAGGIDFGDAFSRSEY